MPEQGSQEAAGFDCYVKEKVTIPKGTTGIIPIGFAITPSQGTYIRLAETSTWAITHPCYLLRVGVIDPDYQGEVTALITFIEPEDEGVIEKGDRGGCGPQRQRYQEKLTISLSHKMNEPSPTMQFSLI